MEHTSATWKSLPLYISSTMRDMHAERDYLCTHVFPRLAEELRKRRHHLEPIDLRWGVDFGDAGTEEAHELLMLKVCLDEIQRSRPFMLVLLGDRYGWTPPEERMAAAALEAGFQCDVRGLSLTAFEIKFGILKEDPSQRQRGLFFFRQPLPYDRMPEAVRADYSDGHSSNARVREGHARLAALKEELRRDPELGPRVFEYTAAWDASAQGVVGLEVFGEMVFQHFWKELEEELGTFAGQPPRWEESERAALITFIENLARHFTGRDSLLSQLQEFACAPVAASAARGVCLIGGSGSGKSAVFAELFQRLSTDGGALLLANAAGSTPRGALMDSMLRRWIQELADFLSTASRKRVTNELARVQAATSAGWAEVELAAMAASTLARILANEARDHLKG